MNINHGENAIIKINELPAGAKPAVKSDANWLKSGYIIGHSETGHHHVLEATEKLNSGFDIYTNANEIFFKVFNEAKVVHKKSFDIHEPVVIEQGIYKVIRKSEYDPFAKIIKKVWD